MCSVAAAHAAFDERRDHRLDLRILDAGDSELAGTRRCGPIGSGLKLGAEVEKVR